MYPILGKHSYIVGEIDIRFPEDGKLTIGNFCSIAENVVIFLGGEHNTKSISTFPFDRRLNLPVSNETAFSKGDVIIGNDVWIGKGVIILSGRTIADGAVIGAYSVVTKDVGPYEIWAGNPARFRRKRFLDHEINLLLFIKWWEWSDDKIKEVSHLLTAKDPKPLIDFYNRSIKNANH